MRRLATMALAGTLMLAFASPAAARPYVVDVFGNRGWTGTYLVVDGGDTLAITARGHVITARVAWYHAPGQGAPGSGPAGQVNALNCIDAAIAYELDLQEIGTCGVDDAYFGELIGMVDGVTFRIGDAGMITIPAGVSGELYLAVNDYAYTYSDNYGKFTITFEL